MTSKSIKNERAVAQIILKLFSESYTSELYTGQGNIFFAGQDIRLSLIELRIGTQNINNTLYPATKGCEASIGTIVCRVQIDGAGCHLEAQSRLSCLAKKNILLAKIKFPQSSIWI